MTYSHICDQSQNCSHFTLISLVGNFQNVSVNIGLKNKCLHFVLLCDSTQ